MSKLIFFIVLFDMNVTQNLWFLFFRANLLFFPDTAKLFAFFLFLNAKICCTTCTTYTCHNLCKKYVALLALIQHLIDLSQQLGS